MNVSLAFETYFDIIIIIIIITIFLIIIIRKCTYVVINLKIEVYIPILVL